MACSFCHADEGHVVVSLPHDPFTPRPCPNGLIEAGKFARLKG